MIYFTSDTHFWHKNILKYCPRPYNDSQGMNEGLIENWNNMITDDDEVYHLGDVAMGGDVDAVADIMNRLNGRKYLIRGNHDKIMGRHSKKHGETPSNYFQWVRNYHEMEVEDEEMDVKQKIILCHYPLQVWNHSHHGS